MAYTKTATTATPALIIYLLDMSSSMAAEVDGRPKIDVVSDTLYQVAREMVSRAIKGRVAAPRYRIAILAYNDEVRDVFSDSPITITDLTQRGIPVMKPSGRTDTAAAFLAAEQLLIAEHSALQNAPAPLVCHLTDGYHTGADPKPIADRIRQMVFPDGSVLIENIFFDSDALVVPVGDPYDWRGISSESELASETAKRLFHMSSEIPASYRELFGDLGYTLAPGARLMFSGDTPEIVEAAFTMSGMTPIA